MRLTRIEIENFKGIGALQSIDLKPITLLFGPNSAGKSTILQALHYLREVIERNNPDPDQTIAGGLTDLGGFANLVHGHETGRSIHIKVHLDIGDDQGSDRLPLNSGGDLQDPRFTNLPVQYIAGENIELKTYAVVQEVGIGIEVAWSDLIQGPYVAKMSVEHNGDELAALLSPPQEGQAELIDINWQHPMLEKLVEPDDEPENWDEGLPTALGYDPEAEKGEALHTITAVSKEVDIVDPFFDLRPTKGNYLATLVSLLGRLVQEPGQSKAIRIHFRDHDTRPSVEVLARDGSAQVKGLLPPGYQIELYAWSQKQGGEDFHDRYVLTDLGGVMIGAGLSADGPGESAAFTLLSFEHAQGLRSRFSFGSTVYSRIGSAVRIRDDGSSELF